MKRMMLALIWMPLIGWGCSHLQRSDPEPLPSFVIILADDLGWADVSCQGSIWSTPAIDALAADGIRFTRAASNGPNCAPSRACLVTGTDVTRHGIFTVRPSARGKKKNRKLEPPRTEHKLKPEAITIAEMLSGHGYRSAHIGKWHLGDDPADQGFDVSIAGDQRGHPKSHLAPWNLPHLPEQQAGTALADALTDHAVDFIEQNADRPFLLILSHYAVHTPVQAPPQEVQRWAQLLPDEKAKRHRYAALVDSVDRSVRRVRESLESTGCSSRTLLIFTSDNGGHEGFTDNGPLRGGKGMLFEGGVRVPFIAWGAGTGSPERIQDVPIQLSDLVPTMLEMSSVPAPEKTPLQGVSISGLLSGTSAEPVRDLVWHFPAYLQGYTRAHGTWRTTPVTSIVRGPWKLLEFHEDQSRMLFHLGQDPSEQNDVASSRPDLVSDLASSIERWRKVRNAPMPVPITQP